MNDLQNRNNGTEKKLHRKHRDTPEGLWLKCVECNEIIYNGELIRNVRICHKCGYYFPIDPQERLELLADKDTLTVLNPRCDDSQLDDEVRNWSAMATEAKISGHRLIIVALNLNFTNHDISLYVCQNIINAINKAVEEEIPLLVVYTDGTALQNINSVLFPSQSLGINAAISRFHEKDLLYISLLANSSSHDCFPGFAYLADIVVLEAKVSETVQSKDQGRFTSRPDHPLVENGMVDILISRMESTDQISRILDFFC